MIEAFKRHWPEYLMEACAIGLFMVSACVFGTLLESGSSPVRMALTDPFQRRILMGAAMGFTAVFIIYSPWGRQSGAHMNPAVTLTFFRLKKIPGADAFFYVLFQFLGAAAGVALSSRVLGRALAESSVNYAATLPGLSGEVTAFFAEMLISFMLMAVILTVSNHSRFSRWTGVFAGILVAVYIIFEAPVSGMSMNPARTFGSALFAGQWQGIWIYFTAPVLGMFFAAEFYTRRGGIHRVFCAKINHAGHCRCIFDCRYGEMEPHGLKSAAS